MFFAFSAGDNLSVKKEMQTYQPQNLRLHVFPEAQRCRKQDPRGPRFISSFQYDFHEKEERYIMSSHSNEDVIRMLKNGMPQEVIEEVLKKEKKAYSFVFVDFMQEMLKKYHMKRTDVARATGISQDYLYKVLNGSKKTAERDYIIAICLAIGMSLSETQHALQISRMPLLSDRDIREHVLMTCISESRGVYRTNEWLERTGYPLLRVSRDMEQYVQSFSFPLPEKAPQMSRTGKHYREIDREVFAEHCGNAPFDYIYGANMIVEDESGARFHVQGYYSPEFSALSVTDEENFRKMKAYSEGKDVETDENGDPWDNLEIYDELEDASDSEFFRFFLEIDRMTDEKVKEVLSHLDDTANYRMRCNLRIAGGKPCMYAEMYDQAEPARHQYFQVREEADHVVYSASHESLYMHMELGELYPYVFGEREEPECYFKAADDLSEVPLRERFLLDALRTEMHERMKQAAGDLLKIDEKTIRKEKMETTARTAAWAFLNRQYDKALSDHLELLEKAEMMEQEFGTDETAVIVTTLDKIAVCLNMLEREEEAEVYQARILDCRERLYRALEKEDNMNSAVQAYAQALRMRAADARDAGDMKAAMQDDLEIIELLERDSGFFEAQEILFPAYTDYAYLLDEEERSEEAIVYYEKGERIVRRYHLEQSGLIRTVMSFYNNYAWVLWNKFENEEAIIYYGRAIELAEDLIERSDHVHPSVISALQHYAQGLLKLYRQTGKTKEAERLIRRLEKYHLDL
ncbi:MAG: helix-turn-helix domain-containing protein [Erysipelotrichaceae bacterium]|nr:helix-turn-helix domain-containing protein [Erysipelotrichaceae bacterium]